MQKSKLVNQSFLNVNDKFIDQYLQKLQQSQDKYHYDNNSSNFDQQLYSYYAAQNYLANPISKQLYQMPTKKAVKLDVPKNNSLTDSMLRTTLGCQENLAQSYLKILDQTQKIESNQKQKRIEQAKKKFAASNLHRDIFANSKAFVPNNRYHVQRPVIDNQHDAYIKTQITFMQNPSSSKPPIDKYSGSIAKKITEIGGIEDTLEPMELSLSNNQLTHVKSRQLLNKSQQKRGSKSPVRTTSSAFFKTQDEGWLKKSKQMRQQLSTTAFR